MALIRVYDNAGNVIETHEHKGPVQGMAAKTTKILFLGGPSGSGKSSFASEYLTSLGWIHLELDQYPKNGIAEHNLGAEWESFYADHKPTPLHKELLRRAGRSPGIVLSFPSNLVFSPEHIHAAANHFRIAYLYGHPAHCLRSFLRREDQTGRRFPASHWDDNNRDVFGRLSCSIQHPFLIDAFNHDGSRREPRAIYQDIFAVKQPGALANTQRSHEPGVT